MYVEDEHTELKVKLTKEIKKEIVAFANTDGGTIYIGIDDNGSVVGLENIKEDVESLSSMIKMGIVSDLVMYTKIKQKKIDGKDVIELNIQSGINKPYYLADKGLKPSGVFLRHGNTSVPASEEVIRSMIINNQNISFETRISQNQNLHFEYLTNAFKDIGIDLTKEKYLTLNIINSNNEFTNLGLLFSDECPYSIKCAIFDDCTDLKFKDRKEFTGSILKQVDDVYQFVNVFNRISGNIVGLRRIDTKDYPEYAIRESILNAVIHRDYNFSGSILVSMYENRIEFKSLGGLVNGLDINDLYMGISQSRNPNVANIFYRLEYVESFGTGIKRIMESYQNYDIKPELQYTDNVFKIILYNVNYEKKEANNTSDNFSVDNNLSSEDKIINYLKDNDKIDRLTVQNILNVSKSKCTEILNKMMEDKLIVRIGNGKSTYYKLK